MFIQDNIHIIIIFFNSKDILWMDSASPENNIKILVNPSHLDWFHGDKLVVWQLLLWLRKKECQIENCIYGHVYKDGCVFLQYSLHWTLSIQKKILNLCKDIDVYKGHRKQASIPCPNYWKFLVPQMQTKKTFFITKC